MQLAGQRETRGLVCWRDEATSSHNAPHSPHSLYLRHVTVQKDPPQPVHAANSGLRNPQLRQTAQCLPGRSTGAMAPDGGGKAGMGAP